MYMKLYLAFVLAFVISIRTNANTIQQYPIEDDKSDMFKVDDSLLIAVYPDACVKPTRRKYNNRTFSQVLHTRITPNNALCPEYLIIVEKNLFLSLTNEIKTYAEDVHAVYGYGIFLVYVENPNPESIKSLIVGYQNNLCGAFLIGNIGESLYEVQNDHDQYGYKNWPCDLFFMDLDGVWIDSDSNGIYDTHSGNVAPDIFLGRLSAAGLSPYESEENLIRRQLKKSHDYWWKTSYHVQNTTLNYIDVDWEDGWFDPNDIKNVFSTQNITDVRYSAGPNFSPSDYLSKISSITYGFTHLAAHSSPIHHIFTNGDIYNYQVNSINSNNYVYGLFCCSACNWIAGNSNGYLGGSYLFNGGKTMAVVGTTKIGGMWRVWNFYPQFASMNLGKSFLYWWCQYGNSHSQSCVYWTYGMTILGDPTIDFRYNVSDLCVNNLSLTVFPSNNTSNLVIYKAGNKITVSGGFVIPQGVHVVFDAPEVVFDGTFTCPSGASFETRHEGCEL